MTDVTLSAGAALLARLKTVGVDYIFANSGTDFPPIIEGLAEAAAKDIALPRALTIPHEHAAMGMAHGYYLASGRAQAVIAHTNVGLANCAIGALNAHVEHVPILLFSGRTPTVEKGRFGARTVPIGWGQEMRDQTSLVREASKWDYELRFPEQVTELVDRAHAIASSSPRGPVYVSLPREVLCEPCPAEFLDTSPSMTAHGLHASPGDLAGLAARIARAKLPVIFAQHGAGSAEGFAALARMTEAWGIPVCQYWAGQLALATDHPMCTSWDPAPLLAEADLVICLGVLAPWMPDAHTPQPDAFVVQLGPNPLSIRTPIRNFRADMAIAADTGPALVALEQALSEHKPDAAVRARFERVAARNQQDRAQALAAAAPDDAPGMTKAQIARALSDALEGDHATVLSELGCPMPPMRLTHHQAWYQEPHAGGLGWSLPAAMGMQLADPDRLIVATMGDGTYMFANPVVCHQIAEALELPILIIVLNNAEWGAVRQSVLGLYPEGHAARANQVPLTGLQPSPDFTLVARASRALAFRAESRAEFTEKLDQALAHVRARKGAALIDVSTRP
ncbi:thiamine pyrophosphate-requiring protein [Roseinatronobacter bogoriensis]|uniref:Acetolactate synthase n=1 Tax=Roseinatronobacter bogoriensis subsp. barguzinensis TaxID=441209 RepID=A0A2K8K8D5_9RHOB|nr:MULTISPECIES: thiamine pyrophosphate-requiring protein [Rhodobaca]ATX65712.1 acetolactate synthase [Rhodobaca barguzinensis]MBB4208342.1 acetolactate synthase-1/2/3 large subunit [Rhodobaca bogoriensis DSM 18756]TDW38983.1 acetolactate synthase-1/2/3 large subunit [Rhodobaca barguzinensis]TDY68834.1 acetolactate synthase-1/2/3 large subunit [Rhodobaca bogoriensis DSM 18756]